jgi:hypothetical protein
MRLWLAGLIEPDSETGWDDALANKVKNVRWRCVYDPQQQKTVAERAAARKSRIASSAEERAQRIVDAMDDPTVRRVVDAMMKSGAGSARAQRGVGQTLRKQHQDRRQQARRAERDKTADADFKRMMAQLWDSRGAVAAIDTHLIEERARVANGEQRRISDHDWVVALRDVRTIIESFGSMWKNVRDIGDPHEPCPACGAPQVDEDRHLRAFAMEGSAVEVEGTPDEEIVEAEVVS